MYQTLRKHHVGSPKRTFVYPPVRVLERTVFGIVLEDAQQSFKDYLHVIVNLYIALISCHVMDFSHIERYPRFLPKFKREHLSMNYFILSSQLFFFLTCLFSIARILRIVTFHKV